MNKQTIKKSFLFSFLAFAILLTPTFVLSVSAAESPNTFSQEQKERHLNSLPSLMAESYKFGTRYASADIDWYLSNPDANEFFISTSAELDGLSFLVNTEVQQPPENWVWTITFAGKTINLTNDIDLSNTDWKAIGWGQYAPTIPPGLSGHCPFSGTFNGSGYVVSGLSNESLFGLVKDATIQNLKTSGTVISRLTTTVSHHVIAGVVNAAIDSNLINLKSDVNLVYNSLSIYAVGGIVTDAIGNTTIVGCEFSGTFDNTIGEYSGAAPVGGIAGSVGFSGFDTTVTINDCVNYADLTVVWNGGGIVGAAAQGPTISRSANIVIKNSVNYGDISIVTPNAIASRYGVGGILGAWAAYNVATPMSVTIDGTANYGAIAGNLNDAGGIAGYIQQGNRLNITNSYNQGDVTSQASSGGIVGRIDNATGAVIKNTYDTGTVGTGANFGGFAGVISGGAIDSVNNYYLDTAAPGAVNSAPYTGVTALTAAQMNNPSFAGMLGDGYVMGEDGYPILAWQSIEPVDKTGLGVKYDDGAVAVKNANRLAVATLWIKTDSGTPTFVGMNNFSVLDSTKDGSLYRVTLGYLVAGGQGFTSANAGLLTISGATGVTIERAKFVSYDDNGNAVNTAYYLEKETGGGVVIPPGDDDPPVVPVNYDLNGDGVVDQLDLAIALSFFTVNSGDTNWNAAKIADFNKDNVVDIEDFIRLLNNMVF